MRKNFYSRSHLFVCVTKNSHLHWLGIFMKGCIQYAHSFTLYVTRNVAWWVVQRMPSLKFLCMQLVPPGFPGLFWNITFEILPSLEIAMPTVCRDRKDAKANSNVMAMHWQSTEFSLYSTVHWQYSVHTGYVLCGTLLLDFNFLLQLIRLMSSKDLIGKIFLVCGCWISTLIS